MGGAVRRLGLATSGVAQGCPLSGLLFVAALDPFGVWLHEVLQRRAVGIVKACVDDLNILVRSASFAGVVAEPLLGAAAVAGLQLKPAKCAAILMDPRLEGMAGQQAAVERARAALRQAAPGWEQFSFQSAARCLGCFWGPRAALRTWAAPLAKVRARALEIAASVLGPAAAAVEWRTRMAPLVVYAGSFAKAPVELVIAEHWAVERVLRLPHNATPRRGHLELTALWGWPRFGSLEVECAVALANRARKWRQDVALHIKLLAAAHRQHSRLAQLTDGRT